jgi:hypothetical protein
MVAQCNHLVYYSDGEKPRTIKFNSRKEMMTESTARVSRTSSLGLLLSGLSGLALLALLFIPWFTRSDPTRALSDASGAPAATVAMTLWQATPGLGYLLLFSAVIAAGITLYKTISRKNPPLWTGMLLIAAGALSIGYMFIVLLSPPAQVSATRLAPASGLWLGALAAIGILSGGLLLMRDQKTL